MQDPKNNYTNLQEALKQTEYYIKQLIQVLSNPQDSPDDPSIILQIIIEKQKEINFYIRQGEKQAKLLRINELLRESVNNADSQIQACQSSLRKSEIILESALHYSRKKLKMISEALANPIDPEELIRFGHGITVSNGVVSPDNWEIGDIRRPYPIQDDMQHGIVSQLGNGLAGALPGASNGDWRNTIFEFLSHQNKQLSLVQQQQQIQMQQQQQQQQSPRAGTPMSGVPHPGATPPRQPPPSSPLPQATSSSPFLLQQQQQQFMSPSLHPPADYPPSGAAGGSGTPGSSAFPAAQTNQMDANAAAAAATFLMNQQLKSLSGSIRGAPNATPPNAPPQLSLNLAQPMLPPGVNVVSSPGGLPGAASSAGASALVGGAALGDNSNVSLPSSTSTQMSMMDNNSKLVMMQSLVQSQQQHSAAAVSASLSVSTNSAASGKFPANPTGQSQTPMQKSNPIGSSVGAASGSGAIKSGAPTTGKMTVVTAAAAEDVEYMSSDSSNSSSSDEMN